MGYTGDQAARVCTRLGVVGALLSKSDKGCVSTGAIS